MKNSPNYKAEKFRIRSGPLASFTDDGNYGCFRIPQRTGPDLFAIISAGTDPNCPEAFGWEHVSVSCPGRCPIWEEMVMVKDLFFNEDEAVFQIHPPLKNYVNFHPYCLHLWRPWNREFSLPNPILVGPLD